MTIGFSKINFTGAHNKNVVSGVVKTSMNRVVSKPRKV